MAEGHACHYSRDWGTKPEKEFKDRLSSLRTESAHEPPRTSQRRLTGSCWCLDCEGDQGKLNSATEDGKIV